MKSVMLNKALDIAYKAHKGQVDKAGVPYILHPMRVALNCSTEEEKIVALLHDVVEDTPITLEELKAEGFSDGILAALKSLTKTKGEDYRNFIQRVVINPLAARVKIQDLKDNMDLSRLGGKPHWKLDLYQEALELLLESVKTKILYIDMDNVLVDFQAGIDALEENVRIEYENRYDEVPGIFSKMQPMRGAVEAVNALYTKYDIYILSTAPWNNSTAWSDKLEWVKRYFGEVFYKRLILTHHKNLNKGDYLIDDRRKNGAGEFEGELILFGSDRFPNWLEIQKYLLL